MGERPKNVLLLRTDQQRADTVGPDKDPRLRMPQLERLQLPRQPRRAPRPVR